MLELDHTIHADRETFNLHGLPKAYDGRPYLYRITYTAAESYDLTISTIFNRKQETTA